MHVSNRRQSWATSTIYTNCTMPSYWEMYISDNIVKTIKCKNYGDGLYKHAKNEQ